VCSAVENLRNALKTVLACGIPDLQLEDLLLKFDQECSELDADGDLVILHEFVIGKPVQHARFSDRRVAYDDQLEQEVLVRDRFVFEDLVRHIREAFHDLRLALAALQL
jgi:hypothetical protein